MLVGGSRLESCTCAAAGAWAGCYEGPHDGWGWEGSKRDKGGWPLRQGHMCSEDWRILQGSVVAVLAVGFLSGESCWGPLQRRSLETTDAGVPCFLPYYYLSSYVSAFSCFSERGGRNQSGFLMQRLKSLGELGARVGDCGWRVSARASPGWCGKWGDPGRRKLFILPFFVWLFSSFLFHCVAQFSYADSRYLPELRLFVG